MDGQEIAQALEWRYATKKFDPARKISAEDWRLLEGSMKLAPSSYGVSPNRFVVIQNSALRERLKPLANNQTQVTDSSHFVIFLYKEKMDKEHIQKYIERIAEVRGVPESALEAFKTRMVQNLVENPVKSDMAAWAQRQAYISMGFLLETAALLKIDSCPMEGFDAEAFDKILDLEGSGWKSVASLALGYRHSEDPMQNLKKVRFTDEDLVKHIP